MPALTRRRSENQRQEGWQIYYGDIHAGTIVERVGNPHDTDQWEWICGSYPGSQPGEHQSGTAATFDEARGDFESAWQVFLSKRTEADFQAWRDQRDWTARKYALWDVGKRLEPPNYGPGKPAHRFRKCPCRPSSLIVRMNPNVRRDLGQMNAARRAGISKNRLKHFSRDCAGDAEAFHLFRPQQAFGLRRPRGPLPWPVYGHAPREGSRQ
jgi:hypothetical protein